MPDVGPVATPISVFGLNAADVNSGCTCGTKTVIGRVSTVCRENLPKAVQKWTDLGSGKV